MRSTESVTLEGLFVELRAVLVAMVQRLVGCRQTAEDVIQDAYMRVSQAQSERGIVHLRAFLFQTARNLALDHLRRERLRRRTFAEDGDEAAQAVACPLPLPETHAAQREKVECLKQAMAGLSERRRAILLLHKVHGWRYGAIARHLGISESAVEKNLRAALAHCLDAAGEG